MRTKVGGEVYTTCPVCEGNKTKPFMVHGQKVGGTRVRCRYCNGRGKVKQGEEVKEK